MKSHRKLLHALIFAAASITAAPLVHADPCEGDLLESQPVRLGAIPVGVLELRYDRINAQHCATMTHLGPTLDLPTYTHVAVFACSDQQCSSPVAPIKIDGDLTYADQAGPVRVDAGGRCVAANGAISYLGQMLAVRGQPHCG